MSEPTKPLHPMWIAAGLALIGSAVMSFGYSDPALMGILVGVGIGAAYMWKDWKTYVRNLRKQNEI